MFYNVSFDICGIVILLLLWFILQKIYVMNSKSSRLFRLFVVTGLIAGILDVVTAYTIEYSEFIPPIVNLFLNTIYSFLANFSTFMGLRYIFSTVKFQTKWHLAVNNFLIGGYAALLAVNLFTGLLFDFKGGAYNKGPLYYVTFLDSILLVLHFAVVFLINRKLFSKKQKILFTSFIFSPVIFVSFQLSHPSYLMTVFSMAIAALLILFVLETPDFVSLEYLRKNLEKEVAMRTQDLENANENLRSKTGELKKANEELERKNSQAKQDMELAAHLQQSLLAHDFNYRGWDVAVKFIPLSGISGDLYDFYVLDGELRGFGLFDVSGHGISSGLVTVLAKNAISYEFRTTLSLNLSDVMKRINDSMIRVKGGIENYLTGVIFRIDEDEPSKIDLSNAGAPYPIYKSKNDGQSLLLMPDKEKPQYGMIGIGGLDVCFQTLTKKMEIGDLLVLYTDGFIEAENEDGDQYGMMRILDVVDKMDGTAQEILNGIMVDFRNFVGATEIEDDISVIVVKRTEENSAEEDLLEELEMVGGD